MMSIRILDFEKKPVVNNNGAIYYVTITTVTSSRLKITCYFHVGEDMKFSWYFTLVFI